MERLLQDVRFGLRMLVKNPLFSLAAGLCIAIGIGANASIFSFFFGILAHPLPFEEPDRLLNIRSFNTERGANWSVSWPDFLDWRAQQHAFEGLMASTYSGFTITGSEGDPLRVSGAQVSSDFNSVLRLAPIQGRGFLPEEEKPDAPRVALIGYGLWQGRFGAAPDLVGRTITVDGEATTVVGIMPPNFRYPEEGDLWVPIRRDPTVNRGSHFLQVIGRMRPGIEPEAAQADLARVAATLSEQYPDSNAFLTVRVQSLTDRYLSDSREYIVILYVVVTLVLLLACANVANLMLTRAAARQREMAVRASLGAGRGGIARLLMTESIVLGLAGGAVGIGLGWIGHGLVLRGVPVQIPYYFDFSWDATVVAILVLISLVSGVLFGLAPVVAALRSDPVRILQAGDGRSVGSRRRNLLRSSLAALQVGLALVVLVGAGLMSKSFIKLRTVEPGFEPENVLTLGIELPERVYPDDERQTAFWQELRQRVKALPGVAEVSAAQTLPMSNSRWSNSYRVEGTESVPEQRPIANFQCLLPGYFKALGIPLALGRDFDDRDMIPNAPSTVIVSRHLADLWWPEQDPIGKRMNYGGDPAGGDPWQEVVGVVEDVRWDARDQEPEPQMYRPFGQYATSYLYLVVKGRSDPRDLIDVIRGQVRELDPNLPVIRVRTMHRLMLESNWETPLFTWLFGIFSVLSIILAAIGVYGVIAYSVEQRRREFGVRMALGASPGRVLKLVMGQGSRLAFFGLVGGLLVAFGSMRFAASLFYGVEPTDPVIYTTMALTMAAVALVASWLPARRATRVDPVEALRQE
jgi:putative ABC transport system permease protein